VAVFANTDFALALWSAALFRRFGSARIGMEILQRHISIPFAVLQPAIENRCRHDCAVLGKKPISTNRPIEGARLNAVKQRQITIKHYGLVANRIDLGAKAS